MKLKKEFERFNELISISAEANKLREKRETLQSDFEDKFPQILKDHGVSLIKSDMRFIDQGSYKLNTTIKNPDGAVDRDVAVIFPLDIEANKDTRAIKKYARDALLIENVRIPSIKEPCVTVGYHKKEEEYIHIDFPIYAQHNGNIYLARGKEHSEEGNYSWEIADPEGLNEYFLDKLAGNDQLRRLIRYTKKWKQEAYSSSTNKNEVPPSIALTLLACEYFVEKRDGNDYDDLTALQHIFQSIVNRFSIGIDGNGEVTRAEINVNLPKQPFSDVLKKLHQSNAHSILFYKRIKKASAHLTDACNVEADHEAAVYVQKVLGAEFEVPEKLAKASVTTNRREYSFG